MTKRYILLLLIFIGINFISCQSNEATNITNDSDVRLVEKKTEHDDYFDWQLILENKTDKKVILGTNIKKLPPEAISINDNVDLEISKLLDQVVYKNYIYYFLSSNRVLWLCRINTDGSNVEKVKIMDLISGSYANFGNFNFNIDRFDNGSESYFVIKHSRVIGKIKAFIKLNKEDFTIDEVDVGDPQKIVKTCVVSDFQKDYYKQENDRSKFSALINDNISKPYFYLDMPLNYDKQREYETFLRNKGIVEYRDLLGENPKSWDSDKLKSIAKEISTALKLQNVIVTGGLYDFDKNTIYVLITSNGKFDIVKYDNYKSYWIQSPFSIKKFSPILSSSKDYYLAR